MGKLPDLYLIESFLVGKSMCCIFSLKSTVVGGTTADSVPTQTSGEPSNSQISRLGRTMPARDDSVCHRILSRYCSNTIPVSLAGVGCAQSVHHINKM